MPFLISFNPSVCTLFHFYFIFFLATCRFAYAFPGHFEHRQPEAQKVILFVYYDAMNR